MSDLFADCGGWKALILEFAADEREFVRRTAFAMMAWASVHRKSEPDATFLGFFPVIEEHASDSRNFVWKAVSWALRSIGKRSIELNEAAVSLSRELMKATSQCARRIGREALKELSAEKTRAAIIRRTENQSKKRGGRPPG